MTLMLSWLDSANDPDGAFPANNLPYGVFSVEGGDLRCGIALGDRILDATGLEAAGILRADAEADVLDAAGWNDFMEMGPQAWAAYRAHLQKLVSHDAPLSVQDALITFSVPMAEADLHMPFKVAEFTDFYASLHHATNVGTMFRGADNALPPNWLHMPIGYNGRASSVVVSGTDIRRPWGQIKGPQDEAPRFAPSARFDIELELGAVVGVASDGPIGLDQAFQNIFGYVLLNDWSARDIQAWEYQPLGPFQGKATATTISPWIVPAAALEPFRTSAPDRIEPLLAHLQDTGKMSYDIALSVALAPAGHAPETISRTNARELYYSSAQQLTHHAVSGCPMRVGDLLGSGTISGPERDQRGALLEMSWAGKEPIEMPQSGQTRSFLEDGDEITLSGHALGDGYRIGFGPCSGRVLPAAADPFAPQDVDPMGGVAAPYEKGKDE